MNNFTHQSFEGIYYGGIYTLGVDPIVERSDKKITTDTSDKEAVNSHVGKELAFKVTPKFIF